MSNEVKADQMREDRDGQRWYVLGVDQTRHGVFGVVKIGYGAGWYLTTGQLAAMKVVSHGKES